MGYDFMHKLRVLQITCNILVPSLLMLGGLSFFLADTFRRSSRYHRNIQVIAMTIPFFGVCLLFLYFGDVILFLISLYLYGIVILFIWQEAKQSLGWFRKWEIKQTQKRGWVPERYYRSIGFVLFMWGSCVEIFRQAFTSMMP